MKDLLSQKEVLIPLCIAESPEISLDLAFKPQENSIFCARRSATLLGLAISMGAAGMLFAPPKATATSSVPARSSSSSQVTLPLETLPISTTKASEIRPIEVPLLKSELKPGEPIKRLTDASFSSYQTRLSANPLSVQSAEGIKVAHAFSPLETPKILFSSQSSQSSPPAIAATPTPEMDSSLAHLRATRDRLQDGLSELQAEKATVTAPQIDTHIQSDDVSQPLQAADKPVPSISSQATAVQRTTTLAAATLLENGFNHPIPIPVPTPESAIPSGIIPARRIAVPSSSEISPTSHQATNSTSQSPVGAEGNPPEGSNASAPTLAAFNQPIPLPVPTPASPMNLATPLPKPELRLSNPQALPIPPSDRPSPVAEQTYEVRPGDTLNSIARRHGLSIEALIRANQLTNPNVITVSQNLLIPTVSPRTLPSQPLSTASSSIIDPPLPLTPSPSVSSRPFPNLQAQAKAVEIKAQPLETASVNSDQTDTEKLKADVSELEATYGHPISSVSLPVIPPPAPAAISSLSDGRREMVDSEWQSDRKKLARQNRSPQLPTLSRPASASAESQLNRQLIGAAPTDVQEYNNNLQIPVGQEVSPELPPLSTPDHSLPDTPLQSSGYIWPAQGVLTSGYGWRWGRMHKGIDIAAPIGTPVLAAAPGEVISAGWNSGGYGNLVKILHADGSITVYAHNSRILVQQGQRVEQGEQISAMGSTGFSTGPHLHFEVHPSGKSAVNPIAYLPSKGKNL